MPEDEFQLYLDLLARLLRMSPEQKEAISNELRDHLEARFAELVRRGVSRERAIRQALEEFGDAAGLAHQFTQLSRRRLRRWIMRCTLATAAAGAVVLLCIDAFLPEHPGVPAPPQLAAQDEPATEANEPARDRTQWEVIYIDPARFVHPDLAQPLDVVFDQMPLEDAVTLIEDSISLPVVLDSAALQDSGVSVDSPVSDHATDDALYLRLNRMLSNVEGVSLDWLLDEDVLLITTADSAEERLRTVSYEVQDLLADGYEMDDLIETVQTATAGPWFDLDGIGGTVSAFGNLLIVRQSEENHIDIAALLAALRTEGRERVPQPPRHAELVAALEQPLDVHFEETPLIDVIDWLRNETGVPIAFDEAHVAETGVHADEPITFRMSGRPLRTVLQFMLENVAGVALDAVIRDGRIQITTAELAEEHLNVHVHDVGDLIEDEPERVDVLLDIIENETEGPWFNLDGIGGLVLVPRPNTLVVRQTVRVQREVARLLSELRTDFALGQSFDVVPGSGDRVETRFYRMDAETAEDLLTLLPQVVAPGTWSSLQSEGADAEAKADRVGLIRMVSAGRKVVTLNGSTVESATVSDEDSAESAPAEAADGGTSVLVIPQAVLMVRHVRSVHGEIRNLLERITFLPMHDSAGDRYIRATDDPGGGTSGGSGFGGGGGGGFFAVPAEALRD